ncbi:MAG TPA: VOC family protein [bacterium]|jgi:uncharacterized glyoxalase superfamily protein PhnB
MEMKKLAVELKPRNLEETIEWYTSVLGFKLKDKFEEDGKYTFARFASGDITIEFYGGPDYFGDTQPALTGVLYFTPDDVDAMWEKVKGKAEVVKELETSKYGLREFRIKDVNGYELSFGVEV